MANSVQISPQQRAPFGVWPANTSWALASAFQATGSGSGWGVGSDLGPTAYADNGAGLVRVTMPATGSLVTGNSVYITGTTAAVYDGYWIVTVIDGTHVDLQGSTYSVNPAAKGTLKETTRYSWLVVGWRKASEDDAADAFPLTTVRNTYGYSLADTAVYENNMNGLRPKNATDEFYLTWTLPGHIKFHHISIYLQSNTAAVVTYDPTTLANKVLPGSTAITALYGDLVEGNIPGHATRAIISAPTAHTYQRCVPILAKDTGAGTITIFGNYQHVMASGSSILLIGSGATDSGSKTLSANPTVDYTEDGEVTILTVSALVDATLGTLQFSAGAFRPPAATAATLNITEDLQLTPKTFAELDYRGIASDVDYLDDLTDESMIIQVPVTGFASADDLYLLNKWRQHQTPIAILQTSESGAIIYQHVWGGRILSVPDTGGIRKHASGARSIMLLLDSQVNYSENLGWYVIVSATASTNAITIAGDVRRWIGPGTAIYIKGSTGNNGLWAVLTATYSASTDVTTVTVTGDLPDDTDDGYVEVYDI